MWHTTLLSQFCVFFSKLIFCRSIMYDNGYAFWLESRPDVSPRMTLIGPSSAELWHILTLTAVDQTNKPTKLTSDLNVIRTSTNQQCIDLINLGDKTSQDCSANPLNATQHNTRTYTRMWELVKCRKIDRQRQFPNKLATSTSSWTQVDDSCWYFISVTQ